MDQKNIGLTDEEHIFLNHHNVSLSNVFDASGMKKKEYHPIMKELGKIIAIGLNPCRHGHRLKSRHGKCLQCDTSIFAHMSRYSKSSYIYIAVSYVAHVYKIGLSNDPRDREYHLQHDKYGGYSDWKIIYYDYFQNGGKIEYLIHKGLSKYIYPLQYQYYSRLLTCQESFRCSYKDIQDIIIEIEKEIGKKDFSKKFEIENISQYFNL